MARSFHPTEDRTTTDALYTIALTGTPRQLLVNAATEAVKYRERARHRIADISFQRGRARYIECSCGWRLDGACSDDDQGELFAAHRLRSLRPLIVAEINRRLAARNAPR